MGKNLVQKVLTGTGSFTFPAGVQSINVLPITTPTLLSNEFIPAASTSMVGISTTGAVVAWGANDSGQLGDNSITNRSSPVSVLGSHLFLRVMNDGSSGFMGMKYNGSLWGWGENIVSGPAPGGRVGDGTGSNRSSPVAVIGNHVFTQFWTAAFSSYGIKSDGSLWAWGSNAQGQLGDNTVASKSSPVAVIGGYQFAQVLSYTGQGAWGLTTSGTFLGWGQNSTGLVGDGTATPRSSPVAAIGGHTFTRLFPTSGTVVIAMKNDGSIWTWGQGTTGICGDGAATSRSSPVAVIGGHLFASAAGGGSAICALKSDGSAWCWGLGTAGQMGNGVDSSRSSPVAVIGGHVFVQVIGDASFLGLKADGTVWGWGTNTIGQLGDGTASNRSSPVAVIGGHLFGRIFAGSGAQSMFGLKADGTVWGWGQNTSGQLGDGTATNRSSPVALIGGNLFKASQYNGTAYPSAIQLDPGQSVTYSLGSGFFGGVPIPPNSSAVLVSYYA